MCVVHLRLRRRERIIISPQFFGLDLSFPSLWVICSVCVYVIEERLLCPSVFLFVRAVFVEKEEKKAKSVSENK